jgi:hypothetical protein
MGLVFSILLILLGALAVYPAVVQTWPATKQWLDKVVPYQAVLGIVMAIWGLIWGLSLLVHAEMVRYSTIIWVFSLLEAVAALLLGLLLGYSLIEQHALRNNPQFQQQGEVYRLKLLARQSSLGWLAIVLGAVNFLMRLVA